MQSLRLAHKVKSSLCSLPLSPSRFFLLHHYLPLNCKSMWMLKIVGVCFWYFLLCGLGVASERIHVAEFHNIYDLLQEMCTLEVYTCFHFCTYSFTSAKPDIHRAANLCSLSLSTSYPSVSFMTIALMYLRPWQHYSKMPSLQPAIPLCSKSLIFCKVSRDLWGIRKLCPYRDWVNQLAHLKAVRF